MKHVLAGLLSYTKTHRTRIPAPATVKMIMKKILICTQRLVHPSRGMRWTLISPLIFCRHSLKANRGLVCRPQLEVHAEQTTCVLSKCVTICCRRTIPGRCVTRVGHAIVLPEGTKRSGIVAFLWTPYLLERGPQRSRTATRKGRRNQRRKLWMSMMKEMPRLTTTSRRGRPRKALLWSSCLLS